MTPSVPRNTISLAHAVAACAEGTTFNDVWKSAAHALLRVDASEAAALGELFERPETTDERRLFVLDLLAGAGSIDAQVVMRRLLSLSVARRNCRVFASFVQRLALVDMPDGPTLRFLMSVFSESRSLPLDVRAACAYALGAAAGHALAAGDRDSAIAATEPLRACLTASSDAAERASLLTALGNAGLPQDGVLVLRFVKDADPTVRSAAALALRKIVSPYAREALHVLAGDPNAKVAASALVALSEHPLSDDDVERLALLLLSSRLVPELDARVLRVLSPDGRTRRSVAVEALLRKLLLRGLESKKESGEYSIAEHVELLPDSTPAPPELLATRPSAPPAHELAVTRPSSPPPNALAVIRAASPVSEMAKTRIVPPPAAAALAAASAVDAAPTTTRDGSTRPATAPPPPHASGAYRMVNVPRAMTGTAYLPKGAPELYALPPNSKAR